jgi:hypothetical protein
MVIPKRAIQKIPRCPTHHQANTETQWSFFRPNAHDSKHDNQPNAEER